MKFEDKVARLRIEKHKGRETEEFLGDVQKLAEGEAFEYLMGYVTFCGTVIDLSFRPMIPRSEAEFWLAQAVDERKGKQPKRAIDLFSGSGCLGLSLAKNIPGLHVDCIELCPRLKEQVERSAKLNGLDGRVRAITGDVWQGARGTYDIITAVPPYVPPYMKEEVMRELHAEDASFFFDKEDGFYFHKQVLLKAKEFLTDEGVLYLEFDMTQREKIEGLVKECGWTKYSFSKDPYGHECVLKLSK